MGQESHGRLSELTDEQRYFYLEQRALLVGQNPARDKLYELWPNASKYTSRSFREYELSKQGKEDLAKVLTGLREDVEQQSLANTQSRILALIEVGERLLRVFRDIPDKETRKLKDIGSEFRATCKELREEVRPGLSAPEIQSAMEEFWRHSAAVASQSGAKAKEMGWSESIIATPIS